MAAFLPETDSEDELPGEWEERVTVDGSVYYAHHVTASTQWTHPRTGKKKCVSAELPFGWERVIEQGNKVVYVDNINKRTTFTDPRLAFAKEIAGQKDPNGFRQKHDASSSAGHVLHGRDLTGLVALVTGATSGVGLATAHALSMQQCEVILAARDSVKAEAAVAEIKRKRPQASVDWLEADLSSLASVRRLAQMFKMRHQRLDFLVLNAGVYMTRLSLTEDGLEEMMQTNYLSHVLLTNLLLPCLSASKKARVVTLTAESHRFSEISASSPPSELSFSPAASQFTPILQYNDSKLFCHLFSRQLHQNLHRKGVVSVSVHPGNLVPSSLHRHSLATRILSQLLRPWTKSPDMAAASVVLGLTSEEELMTGPGHIYINNCFPTQPSLAGQDDKLGTQLWDMTIDLLSRKLGYEIKF